MSEPYQSIVITGGDGMLAQGLKASLRERGHEPVSVDRADYDIADPVAVASLYRTHRPTLLINCAAYTNVDGCEKNASPADAVNGHAVGHLAALAGEYGTTLVQYSTDFVFDGSSARPYRADDVPAPLSAYGKSKLLGEQLLQQHAPPGWLLIRTAWLFGRHGQCFPRAMVEFARAGKPLRVVRDQQGCPTLTNDLADATFELIDRRATGIWHVVNGGQTTWFDFAEAAIKAFDVPAEVAPTTSAEWRKLRPESAKRPAYSVLDTTPFTKLVGREMRPWQEALRDFRNQVHDAGGW